MNSHISANPKSSRVLQGTYNHTFWSPCRDTVYSGVLQHIRNVESCINAGPGSNDRCSPESVGRTPEWTTEFGDISAEPNGITDPIAVRCFRRAHGNESEPVPSADDRYVESAREGGLSPRHDPPVILCIPVDHIPVWKYHWAWMRTRG